MLSEFASGLEGERVYESRSPFRSLSWLLLRFCLSAKLRFEPDGMLLPWSSSYFLTRERESKMKGVGNGLWVV